MEQKGKGAVVKVHGWPNLSCTFGKPVPSGLQFAVVFSAAFELPKRTATAFHVFSKSRPSGTSAQVEHLDTNKMKAIKWFHWWDLLLARSSFLLISCKSLLDAF